MKITSFVLGLLLVLYPHHTIQSNDDQSFLELGRAIGQQLPDPIQSQVNQLRSHMLKFMLHASHRSDEEKIAIFHQAKEYMQKVLPRIFAGMVDEGDSFQLESPPQWTLKSEVDFLLERSGKWEVPAGADEMLQLFRHALVENSSVIERGISVDELERGDEVKEFLKVITSPGEDDRKALEIINLFEGKFDHYFNKIKNVGEYISSSGKITFPDPFLEEFLQRFLNFYYENVGIDVLKDIISDILVLGEVPSEMRVAQIMFKNSGPGLGKTLQMLGKEPSLGGSIKEMMKILESEGKKVPSYLVERLIAADGGGFKFQLVDDEALGTGTIAQVHRAVIEWEGEEIVVALRFLKPGIEQRADDDIRILANFLDLINSDSEIPNIPNVSKVMEGIKDFLVLDLDIEGTIKRQKMARGVYEKSVIERVSSEERSVFIHVPEVYDPPSGKKSSLHVQEFISDGVKFSKKGKGLLQTDEVAARFAAQSIMRLWFEQALFDSGFMHADLHQGNFKIAILEDGKSLRVFIFDYGMAEMVDDEIQRAFILLGAGANFNDPRVIAKALSVIMEGDTITPKRLRALVKHRIDQEMKSFDPENWIKWAAMDLQLKLPDQLGTLARGGKLVTQLPNLVGDLEMSKKVAIQLAKKNLWKAVTDWRYRYPLKLTDLGQVAYAAVKQKCVQWINRFLRR